MRITELLKQESIIDYIQYAKDAYLIFSVQNYYARFAEKESNPKYYFSDNGLLNLFLDDKKPSLLENAVAVYLTQNHPQDVFYLKSPKTGIDIDFYVPSARQVVQVAYSIQGDAYEREVGNLKKFADFWKSAKVRQVCSSVSEASSSR